MCLAPRYRNGPIAGPLMDCTKLASRRDTLCASATTGSRMKTSAKTMVGSNIAERAERAAGLMGCDYRPRDQGIRRSGDRILIRISERIMQRAILLVLLSSVVALAACSRQDGKPPASATPVAEAPS